MDVFEVELERSWPNRDWRELSVIVAVSGGADSVALLRACHRLRGRSRGGELVVAHYNHRMRPEAAADAGFVERLAGSLGLPYLGGEADGPLAAGGGEGLESAARRARYRYLERCAESRGARYVFTAHTADDQAETVLHRILRGTGPAGLIGIPRHRRLNRLTTVVRPLLQIRRQEILAYLERLNQPFCVDATNAEPRFTRNRIRHQLLPQLAEHYNPHVVEALCRLADLAKQNQQLVHQQVERLQQSCVMASSDQVKLDTAFLDDIPTYLIRELFIAVWKEQHWPLRAMTYQRWHELAELAASPQDADTGPARATRRSFPGNVLAERRGSQLLLRKL